MYCSICKYDVVCLCVLGNAPVFLSNMGGHGRIMNDINSILFVERIMNDINLEEPIRLPSPHWINLE